uniref:G-protein coupled receptors family 1 profile domain-containing protein n=1 Tax=Glossina brevipalpis TaxID=37001 RepID=A0A1A9WV41_9MUSC
MAFLYGLVVIYGVLGNASLILTLRSAHFVRLRNPLLLAVCSADFLVTGISAPITLLNIAMNQKTNSLTLVIFKIINFAQCVNSTSEYFKGDTLTAVSCATAAITFFMYVFGRWSLVVGFLLQDLRALFIKSVLVMENSDNLEHLGNRFPYK